MKKWITLALETEYFDFDVDVEIDVEVHEEITEDVGVGIPMVLQPRTVEVTVITVEMEGEKMPPAFIKIIEDTIDDYELGL